MSVTSRSKPVLATTMLAIRADVINRSRLVYVIMILDILVDVTLRK